VYDILRTVANTAADKIMIEVILVSSSELRFKATRTRIAQDSLPAF
jgi:hypothetical protein